MRTQHVIAGPALVAVSLTLLSGAAVAETEADLIAAAKREGRLVWVQPAEGGTTLSDEWAADFNRRYGLSIEVRSTTTGNIPQVVARVMQEFQAGRPSSVDVFVGAENHALALVTANAAEKVDWSWAQELKNVKIEEDGAAVPFMSRLPGITYNARKIPIADAPRTMFELVETKYNLATTPYGANLTTYASAELWGEQRTDEFVRKLAAKAKGFLACGQESRLVTGEFDIFGPDCGVSSAMVAIKKGAPLGYVVPRDAAIAAYFYLAIPKHAEHKAVAKLWINYLVSPSAQQLLYKHNEADYHKLARSKSGEQVKALEARGYRFFDADVAFARRNQADVNRLRGKYLGMLQAGRGSGGGGSGGWGGGGPQR